MMTLKNVIIVGAVLSVLGLSTPSVAIAQEAEQQQQLTEEQRRQQAQLQRERHAQRLQQIAELDIGFTIPTQEQVQARRDARRTEAVSERVGRRVMAAFELYQEDDLEGAMVELREASPRADFDRAYIGRFLGNMLAENEQIDEAIATLEQAVEYNLLSFNDHASMIKLLGDLHIQESNFEESLRYYRQWLEFTGELDHNVFVRMANAHLEMENHARVIPFANAALIAMDEPHRNPYVLQVVAYYEMQQLDQAIEVLEEALNLLPGEEAWWGQLGMFYAAEERSSQSLATLEIAYLAGFLERQADLRALVQMYANEGIPYRAAETMRTNVEAGRIDRTARNLSMSARYYHAAREFSRAADMYTVAIEASEERAERQEFHRRRGAALLLADEYSEAAEAFQNAIRLADSDDHQVGRMYMQLAEAYFYSNNYRQAIDAAQGAAEFSDQRRNAESWASYIRQTAQRRGVDL